MADLVLTFVTTGLLLALWALAVAADGGEPTPHYRLKARLDPARHRLAAGVLVERPPSATCYLHKALVVHRATADGKEVAFHREEAADPLPYAPAASAVAVEARDLQQLSLTYAGKMSGTINDVNMIGPGLVELASYSAWYPIFQGLANFTFEMELEAPAGFVTVTNGVLKDRREEGGHVATAWESAGPGFDMVLLASPDLRILQGAAGDTCVEMYYSRLSSEFMRGMRDGLVAGMEQLSRAYGPPAGRGVLRFACSPRGGWGYSRAPLFVVSEAHTKAESGKAHGEARQFHGYAHEMAHFWWQTQLLPRTGSTRGRRSTPPSASPRRAIPTSPQSCCRSTSNTSKPPRRLRPSRTPRPPPPTAMPIAMRRPH